MVLLEKTWYNSPSIKCLLEDCIDLRLDTRTSMINLFEHYSTEELEYYIVTYKWRLQGMMLGITDAAILPEIRRDLKAFTARTTWSFKIWGLFLKKCSIGFMVH